MASRGFKSLIVPALGALLLAACPELDTPLTTVTGRIVGASAGAHAYPFGRPDLKVAVQADGFFRIEGVPTSASSLVLFDGADRCERVEVALRGGVVNPIPDRFGAVAGVDATLKMPLAASVVAAAIPDGGADPAGTAYAVDGTDVVARIQAAGQQSVTLGPLPAGALAVRAGLAGFVDGAGSVSALSGATVALALPLPIDLGSAAPGCGASLACLGGLHCNPTDGRCYQCTESSQCASGETCDTTSGLCHPTGAATWACAACATDADCDAALNLHCLKIGATSYCSHACTTFTDCPAGFDCQNNRCTAPAGCNAWFQTMGATCVDSGNCDSHLYGGKCAAAAGAAGYCTASCGTSADCQLGTGPAATMTCVAGRCALP